MLCVPCCYDGLLPCASGSLVTSASVQTGGGGRLRSVTPFSELITAVQPRPGQPPPPPQTLQPVTSNRKPTSRNARSAPSAQTFPTFLLTQNLWFTKTQMWHPLNMIIVCIITIDSFTYPKSSLPPLCCWSPSSLVVMGPVGWTE